MRVSRGVVIAIVLAIMLAQDLSVQGSRANRLKRIGHSIRRAFGKRNFPRYTHPNRFDSHMNKRRIHQGSKAKIRAQDNDFTSKCFKQHKVKFIRPPTVHFFPYRRHSASTRACKSSLVIDLPLGTRKVFEPRLDEAKIKAQVIDSGLFNSSVQTYVITHGFMSNWNGKSWLCDLKDLILDNSRANVFILDWSGGSRLLSPVTYGKAVGNSLYAGVLMGEFIRVLVDKSGQKDASQYHVIGHSLGAHVVGHAGYYLNGTLGRITGLDPAGPCFTARSNKVVQTAPNDGYLDNGSRRLSRQSAQIVLSPHTDGSYLGLKQNCGHFDVYVNGGYEQPGCDRAQFESKDASKEQSLGYRMLARGWSMNKGSRCRHAFCWKIFKHLVDAGKLPWNDAVDSVKGKEPNNKCYLVAYRCGDWEAFEAGECGFCLDDDHDCALISPSSGSINKTALVGSSNYNSNSPIVMKGNDDGADDGEFNDETSHGSHRNTLAKSSSWRRKRAGNHTHGQHFLKTGSAPTICTYNYQIIVAVRRQSGAAGQSESTDKQDYYLHIPLKTSSGRVGYRVVQVSHKITAGSVAYDNIKTKYMIHYKLTNGGEELDFYTALITFEPDKCGPDGTVNGAGGEETTWRICHPLDNIRQAPLSSPNKDNLRTVAWIGMNYMSGLDYTQRREESYIFDPIPGSIQPTEARDEIMMPSKVQDQVESDPIDDLLFGVDDDGGLLAGLLDSGEDSHPETRGSKVNKINVQMAYTMNMRSSKIGASL